MTTSRIYANWRPWSESIWKRACLLALLWVLVTGGPAQSHAVLQRSQPPANANLANAPDEIRLWLTEPVEPKYREIRLRDATGADITQQPSQVDAVDPTQMYFAPGHLPNGLYTVVWLAVSAADGHRTEGSFPMTIGATAQPTAGAVAETTESLPIAHALIRWFNLIALVWAVGSIAFIVLVWRAVGLDGQVDIERRLRQVMWAGWVLMGVAALLTLLLQVAVTNGEVGAALSAPVLVDLVTQTRFGSLWFARGALWIVMGICIASSSRVPWTLWSALIVGAMVLALTSLFSHSGASRDSTAAVLADWFHLLMTAVWLGGLMQLLAVLACLAQRPREATTPVNAVDRLVGQFSTVARVAVAGILVTGFYAAWLQVGSWYALFTTLYGRLLLIKLVLIVPLVGIAAVNLMVTQRRLRAGDRVWVGRLRGMVGAEIGLALSILFIVGGMTALNPARNVEDQRVRVAEAAQSMPLAAPLSDMQMDDDLHIQLTITPGWVGENEFDVALSTMDGQPVTDASLIRLRFEHQTEDLGQSELRIGPQAYGLYGVQGSNLSAPGDWKMRLTIQRPDQYDVVADFFPTVAARPLQPPAQIADSNELPLRTPVLLLTGMVALGLGGWFLFEGGRRFLRRSNVLAAGLVMVGFVFLMAALVGT